MKTSIILIVLIWGAWWVGQPCYVTGGTACVASPEIKAAIYRMGPGYDYKITVDGRLMVNTGNGEWLYLKY